MIEEKLELAAFEVWAAERLEIHNGLDECIDQLDGFGAGLLERIWGLES